MSLILAVNIFAHTSYAQVFVDPETRGVWAPVGFVPYDSASVETIVRNLSAANFNVIYVGVWDGHSVDASTIYPSAVVADAGGPRQYPEFVGTDPLRTWIDIAHKYDMEVIAWFELMPYDISVSSDSIEADEPLLLKANPSWALVQRDTTKVGYHHESYGYYWGVDPAVSGVQNFVVNLYTELAKNYPDLDGIQTDIENDTTFSYSDVARSLFMQQTGNPDPLTLPSNNPAWLSWRQLQVTNLVKRIYQSVKQINPQCVMAAAVVPPAWGLNNYLAAWNVWAKDSYVDMVEPMLYEPPLYFGSELQGCISVAPPGFKVSAGTDASGNSLSDVISEIRTARADGAAGEVVWYYTPISSASALATIKSQVFTAKTLPAFDDLVMDNNSNGLFHSAGTWTLQRGGYKGNYVVGQAVAGDTAYFTVRVLRSGDYTLYGYWSGDSATNSPQAIVSMTSGSFAKTDTVDQQLNLNEWSFVDKFFLNSGDTAVIKLAGSDGSNLIADAFRLRRGRPFTLIDYAVPDSQDILLKFSNRLTFPALPITRVSTSFGNKGISYYVDPGDNTVLHINLPPLKPGIEFTLNVDSLVDVSYDTLNVVQSLSYDPDSTTLVVDDNTSGSFHKISGTWTQDTSITAINGEYWLTKQSSTIARAEWGPAPIDVTGYYNEFANIPSTQVPLTDTCVYIVSEHFGTDSIRTSQVSTKGWLKLGSFPYNAGDQFAALVSSVPGADTTKYLVADAMMLQRSVQITGIKTSMSVLPEKLDLSDNYPNPFNPSTVVNVELSRAGPMSLKVYNSLGQLAMTVDDGLKSAGEYKYIINMNRFASGIYFCVLRQGEASIVKKMALIK